MAKVAIVSPKVTGNYSRISTLVFISNISNSNVFSVSNFFDHDKAINKALDYIKSIIDASDVSQHQVYIDMINNQITNRDEYSMISCYNQWVDEKDLQVHKLYLSQRCIVDFPECGLIERSELPEEEVHCKLCKNKVKPSEIVCWWCGSKITNTSETIKDD